MNTYTAQIDDENTHSHKFELLHRAFTIFELYFYIFIHTHTRSHENQHTLKISHFGRIFIRNFSFLHTHTAHLTLNFPSGANCLLSSPTHDFTTVIRQFLDEGSRVPREEDPFYGRKLWLLPSRLEIGEFP